MNRHILAFSLGIGAMMLAAGHAFGQSTQNCAMREQVVARLASAYGESRQSIGIAGNDRVVEVFASLETGTWTITVTHPNGMTCMVAAGQGFELAPGGPEQVDGTPT